jgi:hypothetical protein
LAQVPGGCFIGFITLAEAAGTLHGSAAAEMKRRKWVHDG